MKTQTNAQASRKPWSMAIEQDQVSIEARNDKDIENTIFVSFPLYYKKNKKQALTNARLIVKAVNCHDELVNACLYALNELKHPHPNQENKKLTIDELEQALAKAEASS